eukprot:5901152-Alexandrium_andersonii.AAC.1
MAVLSAAKAAGLVVDLHRCRGALVTEVAEERALALTRLQRRVARQGPDWIVTGCSAETIGWLLPEASCAGFQHRCRCKVTTAIAPAGRLGDWQAAEAARLFGSDTVAAAAPYLGAA